MKFSAANSHHLKAKFCIYVAMICKILYNETCENERYQQMPLTTLVKDISYMLPKWTRLIAFILANVIYIIFRISSQIVLCTGLNYVVPGKF